MWVRATALFKSAEVPDIVWEEMDMEQQDENCEPRKFRFDTNELAAYNETRKGGTTLRLKNGYDISITETVEEIDKMIFPNNS